MLALAALIRHAPAGLYRLGRPCTSETLRRLSHLSRVELHRVSLAGAYTKRRYLTAFARGLKLPSWFGCNWDALFDSLTDFDWPAGSSHVLWLSEVDGFARQAPASFATAIAVLSDATAFWSDHDVRMVTLLDVSARYAPLPEVACR